MTYTANELLRSKRDGNELSADELTWLVTGIADGSLSDAQVGALAMALFIRGISDDERVALTGAMTRSGEVLQWDLDRPVLDKHSTGGVGASGTPAGHSTSSTRSPATRPLRAASASRRLSPRRAARSSARPPTWPPPTAGSTACATPPAPSSRSA